LVCSTLISGRLSIALRSLGTVQARLTTLQKLQAAAALGKPQPATARLCILKANRRPRPVSFMRWLAGKRPVGGSGNPGRSM